MKTWETIIWLLFRIKDYNCMHTLNDDGVSKLYWEATRPMALTEDTSFDFLFRFIFNNSPWCGIRVPFTMLCTLEFNVTAISRLFNISSLKSTPSKSVAIFFSFTKKGRFIDTISGKFSKSTIILFAFSIFQFDSSRTVNMDLILHNNQKLNNCRKIHT